MQWKKKNFKHKNAKMQKKKAEREKKNAYSLKRLQNLWDFKKKKRNIMILPKFNRWASPTPPDKFSLKSSSLKFFKKILKNFDNAFLTIDSTTIFCTFDLNCFWIDDEFWIIIFLIFKKRWPFFVTFWYLNFINTHSLFGSGKHSSFVF